MEFALIVFLMVGLMVAVGTAVLWITYTETERDRDAARDAWTALAARLDLRLEETPEKHYALRGTVRGLDVTLVQQVLFYGITRLVMSASSERVVETEWVAHSADLARTLQPTDSLRRVITGDADFDKAFMVWTTDGAPAPAELNDEVRRAMLALGPSELGYRTGALNLSWPEAALELTQDRFEQAAAALASAAKK